MAMTGRGLLVAGTASDVGKSVLTAGICRWLHRRGVRVAPFKAQNMSNNSAVACSGDGAGVEGEMGRAQAMQAEACGLLPDVRFNPILLKPETDERSQLVILGKSAGYVHAHEFVQQRDDLRKVALATLDELRNEYEVVICEGAGSPAEVNLRAGDISNMGLAVPAQLPTVVVGDINQGGVFAAFLGTLALLSPQDQALISGFVINKFRGNETILQPAIQTLKELTGRQTFGIMPWHADIWLDSEDSVPYGLVRPSSGPEWLRIAVIRLPHISNATDIDPLIAEPGVRVIFTTNPLDLANVDLVLIPGTKSTVNDLEWLIKQGLTDAILAHSAAGKPIMGVCGGFQMLGEQIDDLVESGRTAVAGLGLLQIRIEFSPAKCVQRTSGFALGTRISGYEIHHGYVSASSPDVKPFITYADGTHEGAVSPDGQIIGTHWHGIFDSDEFRNAFLRDVARLCKRENIPRGSQTHYMSVRQRSIDLLGDLVERHLDTDLLWELIEGGAPENLPILKTSLSMADRLSMTGVAR